LRSGCDYGHIARLSLVLKFSDYIRIRHRGRKRGGYWGGGGDVLALRAASACGTGLRERFS